MAEITGQKKELTIAAVDRALDVLLYIYKKGKPVGISEIARDMSQHKSTIFRVLYTLEQKGFVVKNPADDTYWLGMKLFAIGSMVQEKITMLDLVKPFAKQLYDTLCEVVNLSVLELAAVSVPKIVVVYKEESETQLLKANPSVGKFSDCHSSAAGKCLLAFSDSYDIDSAAPYPLTRYTENTITDWQEYTKVLHQTRKQGYALDLQEREHGLTCIGAPILNRQGFAIAAISIAGPTNRVEENLDYKIDCVKTTAERISELFR